MEQTRRHCPLTRQMRHRLTKTDLLTGLTNFWWVVNRTLVKNGARTPIRFLAPVSRSVIRLSCAHVQFTACLPYLSETNAGLWLFHINQLDNINETVYNLGPFTAALAPGQMSPWATEYKKTKINHVYAQLGQIMNKIYKRPQLNCHFWGAGSKSRELYMTHAHGTAKGVGRPPKPLVQPDPPIHLYPHSI